MTSRDHRHAAMLAGVLALMLMLACLGALQYRWISRTSASERDVLKEAMRTKAESFRDDLNRELTQAFATLGANPAGIQAGPPRDFAVRYRRWLADAHYPRLLKNVYYTDATRSALWHFDPSQEKFETVTWPNEMVPVRTILDKMPPSGNMNSEIVLEQIPALVRRMSVLVKKGNQLEIELGASGDYIIFQMDMEYIRDELIPALLRRHFGEEGARTYSATIVSRVRPGTLIFPKEWKNSTDPAVGDVTVPCFQIVLGEIRSARTPVQYNFVLENANRKPAHRLPRIALPRTFPVTMTGTNEAAVASSSNGVWEFVVRGPAGSLDAAVSRARNWNLAMSFGLLLLVGASAIITMVSSRRAERLARRQVAFVAGVSHEFRTPLAVIQSLSDNLATGRVQNLEQAQNYGEVIRGDARRLTTMVEQVLEFASTQNSNRKVNLRPVDAGELVRSVFDETSKAVDSHQWHCELHIDLAKPAIMADESMLRRALNNMLANALKYGADAKWLAVRVSNAVHDGSQMVAIEIEDHGPGIAKTDLPHIFEPFYRGSDAVAAQVHGTGLGLALVKDIVKTHGGHVSVKNGIGRGSIFLMELPVSATSGQDNGTEA